MRGISILLTYAFLLAAIVVIIVRALPARHNPFAPIDLESRPGVAIQAQLARLKGDREACFTALDEANVGYTPLEDELRGEKCGLFDALTLDRTLTPYSATLQMTCAQTAAAYMWERHVVRPAAVEIFDSPVARIETYGSFSCRNIAGTRRLSQHAFGNALDVSGFRLEDGRLIDVEAHWGQRGKEGIFLKRVHEGACGIFSVTLGPEYNAAHADHFHMDMGPGGICR